MIQFLQTWGSLIVAAIALLQPWIISLWRKVFQQGTIDIHETRTIEVGYSLFGATIGIYGTLRAVRKDSFVQRIELTVTKVKDSSKHVLQWGLFRPPQMSIGVERNMTLEIPSGFMLTTSQPHRYNILFFDIALQSEIRPHIENIRQGWYTLLSSRPKMSVAGHLSEVENALENLYAEFSKSSAHVQAFTAIDRLCYWEPGQYELQMRVVTARPERSYTKRWKFELSDEEVERLRLNIVGIAQEACGRVVSFYNFAYPEYQEVTH